MAPDSRIGVDTLTVGGGKYAAAYAEGEGDADDGPGDDWSVLLGGGD